MLIRELAVCIVLLLSFPCYKGLIEATCPPCICCNNSVCPYPDTKRCFNGCMDGYWGSTCSNRCPITCVTCLQYTEGACEQCKEGFYNGFEQGRHYTDCSLTCKSYCKSCKDQYSCDSCFEGYYIGWVDNGNFRWVKGCLLCPDNCINCIFNYNMYCTDCLDGFYGETCQSKCPKNCHSCESQQKCNSCENGFFGTTCLNECSVNCLDNICDKATGYCSACKNGLTGSTCNTQCPENCYNGSCDREGRCFSCKSGYYGIYCYEKCPSTCINHLCDGVSGQCTHGCLNGFWDKRCDRNCLNNCRFEVCSQHNGSCTSGCNNGFYGELCQCSNNCECDASGSCISCKPEFAKTKKMCTCKETLCVDETCLSCSDASFYGHMGACCPCNPNCKNGTCISESQCSYGCKSGYFESDCSMKCAEIDPFCEDCPVNFGHVNNRCNVCNTGYYPSDIADLSNGRCIKCDTCIENMCNSTTGRCLIGCKNKKYGDKCLDDCPEHCLECNRNNGTCEVCEGGMYKSDCSQECSSSCNTTNGILICEIKNGACLNGCRAFNLFGEHCDKNCSSTCKDNVCHWQTGGCIHGCEANFWGKQCENACGENCIEKEGKPKCDESEGRCLEGCADGYFSEKCDKRCSVNCLNTSCGIKGKCLYGCSGDFLDDSCLQVKSETMQGSGDFSATIGGLVGGAVTLFLIIIVAVVIVLCKRRHRKASVEKGNHQRSSAVHFGEVAESVRRTELNDSAPVYATPDKTKKDATQTHIVNNPNYQRPSVAIKQSVTEKVAAVYENAVLQENAREGSKPESDARQPHEDLTRASKSRQSLGRYLLELEDPDENAGSSSAALVLESSGSHVKESDVGDTYYNTADVFKRKIPLDKLAEFVGEKTRECFEEEFKLLPEGLIKKYIESQKKDNITKNRYRGIYPYDDTRVILRDGESDYINASFIDGYKKLKPYIASLGPTYKYMEDMSAFWRMVWQKKCGKIIMLTNLMEGGTRKCDQYWPEKDSSQLYADINVTCLSEETYADYTVRLFNIQKDSAKRTVTQVHFTAWPDQGVPDDVTCLIEFRQRVISVKTNLDGPILVHCSAGIGRTGTYIALDSLTKEGESEGSVDIYACVRNMREQRVNMVQTAEQYEYLHKAVVHSLTFDSHAIELNKFHQYMTKHDSKNLAQKFHDLDHSVEKRSKDENEAIIKNSAIKEKNRVGADIPGDRNRPRLYLNFKPGASDYINALYVNGYRHLNRFILAQTPLPETVEDFLTLVVQEKCSCIVNMEPEANKSKDVGIYFPADNQTLKRGAFTVRTERVTSSQNFTHRRLTLSNHGKAGTEDHTVQHFQLTSWVDGMKCPEDAASFLDFLHHVELKSGGAEAGPVLVHCLTGAEKCGLFCVVAILLEKIQCDQEVSVVNTVRQVKSRRHRVIPNQEQYIFSHQCVNEYIRLFDNYSNFASRQ